MWGGDLTRSDPIRVAIHFGLGLKNGIVLSIFVIYGWSGSNGSKKNASKTNLLMQAILKERETQPSGPVLIMGDLNADPENIATTKEMLVNGLWVDVGAHAARWNGINKEYTCVTARSKAPTRRDYIFCNHVLYLVCLANRTSVPGISTNLDTATARWNTSLIRTSPRAAQNS